MATRKRVPKVYQGLDKYTWIRRSRRTYRQNKPKFFAYFGGVFLFLFLCYVTYTRVQYNQMLQERRAETVSSSTQESTNTLYSQTPGLSVKPGVPNSTNTNPNLPQISKSLTYQSDKNDQNAQNSVKNEAQPPSKLIQPMNDSKIYNFTPPIIDNLTLGQTVNESDLTQKQYKILVKISNTDFLAQKDTARYKMYDEDNGLFLVEVKNNKIVKTSLNFEKIDTKQLTQKVLKFHAIEPDSINCMATKVLNAEKLQKDKIQEFVNTDICQTQAKSKTHTLQVVSLTALNKTMISFELN